VARCDGWAWVLGRLEEVRGSGEDWWVVVGGWWLVVGSWCVWRGPGVGLASGQGRRILSNNMQPAFALQTPDMASLWVDSL
jgi:hypothetical protein